MAELSPEEQSTLDALLARQAEPDTSEVVDAVTETAEEVAGAVAEAVAENVEPDPIMVELPDPIEQATADAIRIQAEADADVIRIEAQADAERQRIAAQADADSQVIETVGDELAQEAVEEQPPMPEPDQAPKTSHPLFKKLW